MIQRRLAWPLRKDDMQICEVFHIFFHNWKKKYTYQCRVSFVFTSILLCMCMHKVTSVMSDSLWPYGLYPTRLLCPWDSLGKNTGVGCPALLQGIFPIQGSNPSLLCLLHWQAGSFTTGATWEDADCFRGPGRFHMLRSNEAWVLQLPSLYTRTAETRSP